MTKKELEEENQNLRQQIEELENDVDYWIDQHNELDKINDKLQNKINELEDFEGIKDVDNFIRVLKINGLYTTELEDFIENYLKFCQEE